MPLGVFLRTDFICYLEQKYFFLCLLWALHVSGQSRQGWVWNQPLFHIVLLKVLQDDCLSTNITIKYQCLCRMKYDQGCLWLPDSGRALTTRQFLQIVTWLNFFYRMKSWRSRGNVWTGQTTELERIMPRQQFFLARQKPKPSPWGGEHKNLLMTMLVYVFCSLTGSGNSV